MVVAIYSFQYIRAQVGLADEEASFEDPNIRPRAKVRLAIDDVLYAGAGMYAIPTDPGTRGTGIASRAERTSVVAIGFVGPGAHTVNGMAAQGQAKRAAAETKSDPVTYATAGPTEGVCIGNRRTIVLTFANAVQLGG
jgi:hypothetical protein